MRLSGRSTTQSAHSHGRGSPMTERTPSRDAGGHHSDVLDAIVDVVAPGLIIEILEKLRLTRIVVAHRLSTIRTADRIIVLVAGKVAQEGTLDELMAAPGHFRDPAERQLV